MVRNKAASTRVPGAILDRLAAGGKKTVVAFGLLALMAFMWVRVLIGHRPGAAEAAPERTQEPSLPKEKPVRARFIELPKVPGRNDSIHSDFFAVRDWARFQQETAPRAGTATEVQTTSENHAQEVIQRIAQRLRVGAVLHSDNSQAFVNDQLLKVGDIVTVKDGADSFDFEVQTIHEDAVLVECKGIRLTLKLAQSLEVNR